MSYKLSLNLNCLFVGLFVFCVGCQYYKGMLNCSKYSCNLILRVTNEPALEIVLLNHIGDQGRLRRACAVSPEPSLFAHTKYESRRRVRSKIRHLASLDVCTCMFDACLKNEFVEDEKYHNLISWLN